jgi:hypothetical protein
MGKGRMCGDLAISVFLKAFVIVRISERSKLSNNSLWVFYFYWNRRPVFYEELVNKRKGALEGINVIRFQWPSDTATWLDGLDKPERVSS